MREIVRIARWDYMFAALAFVSLLFIAVNVHSQEVNTQSGRICIAPLSRNVPALDHDMPEAKPQRREPTYDFFVQVDNSDRVPVPKGSRPTLLGGIPLGQIHKILIYDGKELIESFRFTFEKRGANELCLSYGSWYQTWTLDVPRPNAKWCGCKPSEPKP